MTDLLFEVSSFEKRIHFMVVFIVLNQQTKAKHKGSKVTIAYVDMWKKVENKEVLELHPNSRTYKYLLDCYSNSELIIRYGDVHLNFVELGILANKKLYNVLHGFKII